MLEYTPPFPTQLQGITDLTVVADIKEGLIDGLFDSRSYAWRLKQVLTLLDAARHASREASDQPNLLVDMVGRLRGVHFFRFGLLPGNRQLFLNVTFDGGWEPYIRLIWGPLGTMLDLIFCHCKDYPLAATSSFDDYVRWIRHHEVPGLFFYADSSGSAGDRSYLNRLEALQRASGNKPGADLRAAQLTLEATAPPPPGAAAVTASLRSMKGLFGLNRFFPTPSAGNAANLSTSDGAVLLRFSQDYLADLRTWYALGLFDPGQRFDRFRAPFERERTWLMSPRWTRPSKKDLLAAPDPASLQAGILQSPRPKGGGFLRGAVVLARVVEPEAARGWLSKAVTEGLISNGTIVEFEVQKVACSIAITCSGLRKLGLHEKRLASLPAEFLQGMEARAGLLGDLRGNHPQQWRRPRAGQKGPGTGTGPAPLDMGVVDLVIQLRTGEVEGEDRELAGDRSQLLPRLEDWIEQHLKKEVIEWLAVEPTWGRPTAANEPAPRNHYGFVDGVSQPTLAPSANAQFWDDAVKTGELLLGWVNDRGDGPLDVPNGEPAPIVPDWLQGGTFLVLRKIRQYVVRFDEIVERSAAALVASGVEPSVVKARELVRGTLMGRASDGTPLVAHRGSGANDFDFRHDGDGGQCPFASHVRRANPRAPLAGGFPLPRIVRRGMSYGPPLEGSDLRWRDEDERGILFMAYNASIAEQFEVIQRWLTGGNSSGVSSSQPDPFLGVPQTGEPTVYRVTHGDQVIRIDLGDQPLSRLEWGLYAFVPSIDLLKTFDKLRGEPEPVPESSGGAGNALSPALPEAQAVPAVVAKDPLRAEVKEQFEDDLTRGDRWKRVCQRPGGVEPIGDTVIVGGYEQVKQVLDDDGSTFSVSGYGKRMEETLGRSPFGLDNDGPHAGHEDPYVAELKSAITTSVTEAAAFIHAHGCVAKRLTTALAGAQRLGLPAASIDVAELGVNLIADLCQAWFGVSFGPGEAEAGTFDAKASVVRCPGDFLVMARKVFSAYPNGVVEALATAKSTPLRKAVAEWVSAARASQSPPPVMAAVLGVLDKKGINNDEQVGIVANVMLGLPATLLGTWVKVLMQWTADRRLWSLQHELSQRMPGDADHTQASKALLEALIFTMAVDPVADGIWRTVQKKTNVQEKTDVQKTADQENVKLGEVVVTPDQVIWLGLGAALSAKSLDQKATADLLFGGTGSAPHACPGRYMATGALLGALAALLQAGTWSATASPTVLSLSPSQAPSAPAPAPAPADSPCSSV